MEQIRFFTVKEIAEQMRTNAPYVYKLINSGLLPAIKLGSYKVRSDVLEDFYRRYDGYNLADPSNIKRIAN